MNLYIDIGNHRIKWAAGESAGSWDARGHLSLEDELSSALANAWKGLPVPGRVAAVNVAGDAVARRLAQWVQEKWSLPVVFIRASASAGGVRNCYRLPDQLGSDRWAALIGARSLNAGPVCVVDCGTAVTVDAVAADGAMVGGAILPGLTMARRALVAGTRGIAVDDDVAPRLDGSGTAECVAAGTLYGLAGGIDRLLAEYEVLLGDGVTVFITGGDAPRVQPHLHYPVTHVNDLVLRGLARLAEQVP